MEFAVEMLLAGVPLEQVSVLLGVVAAQPLRIGQVQPPPNAL